MAHRVDGLCQVLKYDAAEYCRRSGQRPYTMAREAGTPIGCCAGSIRRTLGHRASPSTGSKRPLSALSSGPIRRDVGGKASEQGFLLRRVQEVWEHQDFADIIRIWREAESDARRIDEL